MDLQTSLVVHLSVVAEVVELSESEFTETMMTVLA